MPRRPAKPMVEVPLEELLCQYLLALIMNSSLHSIISQAQDDSLTHRGVGALNVSLLALLVRPRYPMPLTVGQHPVCEDLLELTAPVRLDQLHPGIEAPCHSLFQEGTPLGGRQRRRQQDVRLLGVDVYGGEGKHASET